MPAMINQEAEEMAYWESFLDDRRERRLFQEEQRSNSLDFEFDDLSHR